MDGFYKSNPRVIVVHCVDTEGPIGGDVRRRPDGSKEFMDKWDDIKDSLHEITSEEFRSKNKDSFGNTFKLNWFIMDFTGFKTNPKERICEYNNTYDNIKSLSTDVDSFHWHYHQPPKSGAGDQWSDSWSSSKEHYNILGRRIIDRQDFPEAYRAGGTIEDNKCSLWLEENIMIDYSNRVSNRSYKTDNIFDFNWFSAPSHWGYYRPDSENFLKHGNMRRYIVKSVDLESRLHRLNQADVNNCFRIAKETNQPIILSYFSHDHRDMRKETKNVIYMIKEASKKYNIDYCWSDALKAVQYCENIKPVKVKIGIEKIKSSNTIRVYFDKEIYQKNPFIYIKNKKGNIRYIKKELVHVPNCPYYLACTNVNIQPHDDMIGVACTSLSGDKSVLVKKINNLGFEA
jgi:hypothetical protein